MQIEAWKIKNSDISSDQKIHLLGAAVQAICRKSLETLSRVTVRAVVDRTLHECKEKFPALIKVTIDDEGLNFDLFFDHIHQSKDIEIENSLEYLLLELLEVFGKITAEILTKYLHQELMRVTYRNSTGKSDSNAPTVKLTDSTTDRDKK